MSISYGSYVNRNFVAVYEYMMLYQDFEVQSVDKLNLLQKFKIGNPFKMTLLCAVRLCSCDNLHLLKGAYDHNEPYKRI